MVSKKIWVAEHALMEDGTNWYDNPDRILEYFLVSTGKTYRRDGADAAVLHSWCTYFAHWCLWKAGIQPLPKVGAWNQLDSVHGSCGRFSKVYNHYTVGSRTYTPKLGDLYYHQPHQHIGVIVGVTGDGERVWTTDGDAGEQGDALFYKSRNWHGKVVKRIGDGYVHTSKTPKKLPADDWYYEIPDS